MTDDIDALMEEVHEAELGIDREWRRAYDAEQRRHKRRVWRVTDSGGRYMAGYLVGQEVTEGGWCNADGKASQWMTKGDIERVQSAHLREGGHDLAEGGRLGIRAVRRLQVVRRAERRLGDLLQSGVSARRADHLRTHRVQSAQRIRSAP